MKTRSSSRDKQSAPEHASAPGHTSKKPLPSFPGRLPGLEQAANNQAVQRLLQSGLIQAKLTVGRPDDPFEQEADRVADAVMRMPDSEAPAEPVVEDLPSGRLQRMCAECEEEQEGGLQALVRRKAAPGNHGMCTDCEEELRRKPVEEEEDATKGIVQPKAKSGATNLSPGVESRVGILRSGGQPLTPAVRSFFEPRFGRDFSDVKVHTDSAAMESARSIRARAYTHGSRIVFGPGEFKPRSTQGRALLAHELTHVAQQGRYRLPLIQRQHGGAGGTSGTSDSGQAGARGHGPLESLGQIPNDDKGLREFVIGKILEGGIEAGRNFASAVATSSLSPGEKEVKKKLDTVVEQLHQEHSDMLLHFDNVLWGNTQATLDANEQRAKQELVRYGVTEEEVKQKRKARGVEYTETRTVHHMDPEIADNRKLQAAAEMLRNRLQRLNRIRAGIADAQGMPTATDLKRESITPPKPKDPTRLKQLQADYKRELQGYKKLQAGFAEMFPILADLSRVDADHPITDSRDDLAKVAKLNEDSDPAAQVIANKVNDTLKDIDDVRGGLSSGEVNPWRLDPMVSLTEKQLDLQSDAVKQKLFADKRTEESPSAINEVLMSLALIVLDVAAILLAGPTGGLSLVVGAGINAALAMQSVKEYLVEKALAGSAVDQAHALSQEDPSLFWVALEVGGIVFDVADAAKAAKRAIDAFDKLAPLAKAARNAKGTAREAAKDALRRAALGDKAHEELAERLIRNLDSDAEARALQELGARADLDPALKSFKEAGSEAAEASKRVAKADDIPVKEVPDPFGGEVKLGGGGLWSCASPCTRLRKKYQMVLAQDDSLSRRLADLEKEAKKATTKEAKQKITNKAAVLEAELRKAGDMRIGKRQLFLGRTPSKKSRTGREVLERMRRERRIQGTPPDLEVWGPPPPGEWTHISETDMGHKTDAVTWWNETGRKSGVKTDEVRRWMLDSKNYELQKSSWNRSEGSRVGQRERYLDPEEI